MTRQVLFRPAAVRDLLRLADFIVDQNPGAAVRVGAALRKAAASLSEMAERGRPGPRSDLRELIVSFGKSRYVLRYQVRPDAVVVLRIWHSRELRDR